MGEVILRDGTRIFDLRAIFGLTILVIPRLQKSLLYYLFSLQIMLPHRKSHKARNVPCSFPQCKKLCKDKRGLTVHMSTMHPGFDPLSVGAALLPHNNGNDGGHQRSPSPGPPPLGNDDDNNDDFDLGHEFNMFHRAASGTPGASTGETSF